jgi:hypothetical protein
VPFSFDDNAPALRKMIASRITGISKETREAIRATVVRGFREKIDPMSLARILRDVVGLSTPQAHAVMNYRNGLLSAGSNATSANAAARRYADQKIRERSETIARTEVMTVLNRGQDISRGQAVDEGLIDADVLKVWIVTPDELLCPICEPMAGEAVPIDEDFEIEGPPAHPNCRCTTGLRRAEDVKERQREIQERLANR